MIIYKVMNYAIEHTWLHIYHLYHEASWGGGSTLTFPVSSSLKLRKSHLSHQIMTPCSVSWTFRGDCYDVDGGGGDGD